MLLLDSLAKVLPVLLLILLGALLRRSNFFGPGTLADLKRLIVTVTLPAALFLAFSTVTIRLNYLVIVAGVFFACVLALFLGRVLRPTVGGGSAFFPSLLTGFEAGMVGYAIFGAVYGQENIYKFGIVDLGQVLFVFFVLVPSLQRMGSDAYSLRSTIVSFARTPVILAIAGGLIFGALGLPSRFEASPMLDALLQAARLAGAMTTPLVAIVIGYELAFRAGALRRPAVTTAVRLLIWVPAGLLFAILVVGRMLGLDPVFQAAVMTMVLLPAPYVIPIFMRTDDEDETNAVVNTLTLGTLVTLVAYPLVVVVYPPLQ